jgi:hypothetical protein
MRRNGGGGGGDGGGGMRADLDAFMSSATARLPAWPPHVLDYLRLVMIARGGAKALSIRSEVVAYAAATARAADEFSRDWWIMLATSSNTYRTLSS